MDCLSWNLQNDIYVVNLEKKTGSELRVFGYYLGIEKEEFLKERKLEKKYFLDCINQTLNQNENHVLMIYILLSESESSVVYASFALGKLSRMVGLILSICYCSILA